VERLPAGAWLTPGFIDVQVNGGGDALFNDDPSPKTLAAIAAAHRRFGTTGLLPTLITDAPEKMRAAIAAVRDAMRTNPGVLGIHLEGPFISAERPGVHRAAAIRAPTEDDPALLTSLAAGATLVTLAPESVPKASFAGLPTPGFWSRSAIPWRPTRRRGRRSRTASPASRISSTRCARSPPASPAPSPPRSKRQGAGTD
jgi:N-acetylglucosamine-6-phosphate deacetylase